jgi:hypothetical protein
MWNETFHPVSEELIERFLSGKKIFTDVQKDLIRSQIHAANENEMREYKVFYDGPLFIQVMNGEIIGTGTAL